MRYASKSINLPKFGMVYYNNLLSTALLLPLLVLKGELQNVSTWRKILTPQFISANIFSGVLGFYLNFASLWCISSTSATTFAIVGSMNKIPITVLGFFIFDARMTTEGIVFVVMSMLGGFLYAYSKLVSSNRK